MDLQLLHNGTLASVNPRVEYHGDDKAIAVDLDINLNDIEAGELDQLALDGENYSTGLWCKEEDKEAPGGYCLTGPRFGAINTITLNQKIGDHYASVSHESADKLDIGVRGTIEFSDAVVIKVKKFTPKQHGVADLVIQVQGELTGEAVGKLVQNYLGQRVQLDVHPLNHSLLDESEAEDQASESGQGAVAATG